MRWRHLVGLLIVGVAAGVGCGDSSDDEGGGTGGKGGASGDSGLGGGSGSSGTGGGAGAGGGAGVGGSGTGGSGTGGSGTGGSGTGGSGTGGSGTGGSGTGGSGTGGSAGCVPITCQGKTYQCGDCVDNDGDGKKDMADPDCLGPCHNAENTYYGSIPGQSGPACLVDCYFDQDSGSGNDQCNWNHECDPLAVAPNYPPEGLDQNNKPYCKYDPNANTPGTSKSCAELNAKQTTTCENFCGPLTPNGCDCFGCCELPAGGGKYVWLGSEINDVGSCSLKDVGDPKKCQPCTPVQACLNKCEKCELCLGKTTLPADCFPPPPDGGVGGTTGGGGAPSGGGGSSSGGTTGGGGSPSGGGGTSGSGGSCGGQICPTGKQPCGLSCQPACPSGQFCLTGCCTAVPS